MAADPMISRQLIWRIACWRGARSQANTVALREGLASRQAMSTAGVSRPASPHPMRPDRRRYPASAQRIEADARIPRTTGSGGSPPSSSTPRLRPIHSPLSTFSGPRFSPMNFPSVVGTAYSIGAGATQSCTAALTFPRSSTPTTRNFMSSMRRSTRHVPSARERVVATTSKVRRSRIMILPMAGWFRIRRRPSGASGSLETGALPARYPKPAHRLPTEHRTRVIARPFTATSHPPQGRSPDLLGSAQNSTRFHR